MTILNSFYKVVQMKNRHMFLYKILLLSEWFFCISVKACCITFQGHLVIKDFVEVIEFGTPCTYHLASDILVMLLSIV